MGVKNLQDVLLAYSDANGYPVEHTIHHHCVACGGSKFTVSFGEEQGIASTRCANCHLVEWIADSAEYKDDESMWSKAQCPCGLEVFEVALGLAFYQEEPQTVRWLYIGQQCCSCGDAGVYEDWKCELEFPGDQFRT